MQIRVTLKKELIAQYEMCASIVKKSLIPNVFCLINIIKYNYNDQSFVHIHYTVKCQKIKFKSIF